MRRNSAWNDQLNVSPDSPSKCKSSALDLLAERRPSARIIYIRKKGPDTNIFAEYFREFTSNTSLHGLKYLGESRPLIEKIWWTVMFALCLFACGHLIMKVWNKWDQSPVIVSFAESSTPIWQVPFPAVTICSETKARQTVYNFTEMYHKFIEAKDNMTEDELKKYEAASLVCDNHLLQKGNKTTDFTTVEFLAEVAPNFDEMMWHCKWQTQINDCSALFTPILTEEGSCYTFNILNVKELFKKEAIHSEYHYLEHNRSSLGWTLDGGYPTNAPLITYPYRGTGAGTKAGLVILLRAFNNDLDYLCRGPVQGFKISLHTPAEIPRVSTQYFRVPLSQEVIAAVKPNMMTTSEGLRNYDPQRRQCFFPSERKLRFFQVYTQNNCELECVTNYTMLLCDCVTFSMPRDESMPICSSGSTKCVSDASSDLLTRAIKKGLDDKTTEGAEDKWAEKKQDVERIAGQCNCLPACTSINYDVEISQADFNWPKLLTSYKMDLSNMSELNMARVTLLFKESQFITSRRSELYGQTDFLANCGGLLGLCLGFSILSLFEILYFITLRACCNLRNKLTKRKADIQNSLHDLEQSDILAAKS